MTRHATTGRDEQGQGHLMEWRDLGDLVCVCVCCVSVRNNRHPSSRSKMSCTVLCCADDKSLKAMPLSGLPQANSLFKAAQQTALLQNQILVDGFTMLVGKLKVENSGFEDPAKQCALGTSGQCSVSPFRPRNGVCCGCLVSFIGLMLYRTA